MVHKIECLLILTFMFTCLGGCNSGMSRARAKSLLGAESDFKPGDVTFEFSIPGFFSQDVPSGFNEIRPEIRALEKAGLVNITPTKCGMWQNPRDVCGVVAFTEKGVGVSHGWAAETRTASNGRPVVDYHVPVASRVIKEITGITEEPMAGTVANFIWGCDLNDLGQKLQPTLDQSHTTSCPLGGSLKKSQAVFKRYDDGWRLEEVRWYLGN